MSGHALARAAGQLELEAFWVEEAPVRPARPKHLCTSCQERQARFRYRGVVKADRAHTLCFECYRAELNRQRTPRTLVVPPVAQQVLPLAECQRLLDLSRRRAQIAARHAIGDGAAS